MVAPEQALVDTVGNRYEQSHAGPLLGAVTWAVAKPVDYWERTHEDQRTTRQSKIGRERYDEAIHIFLLSNLLCAQAILVFYRHIRTACKKALVASFRYAT